MKKGQAAMEFLMTYGWAILIVLLAIAALAYFGVLSPGKYVPSSCVLETGLACTDFKVVGGVNTSEITIYVRNGIGQDLRNFSLSIPGECVGTDDISVFVDGTEEAFVLDCTGDILGSRIKEDIFINYFAMSGMQHTKLGSISSRVEE